MTTDEKNLHTGHRKRMCERLLSDCENLQDYELLEIILYSALPRHDTNLLAHKLIKLFGSLGNVLSADEKLLLSVKGVGERVAAQIKLFNELNNRVSKIKAVENEKFVYSAFKTKLIEYYKDIKRENFIFYFLDSRFYIINKLVYESEFTDSASANINDLVEIIALNKPKNVIIVHNHLSGDTTPSLADDTATKKLHLIFSLHGVCLLDHIIVSEDSAYSYYYNGRLDKIIENTNLDKLIK